MSLKAENIMDDLLLFTPSKKSHIDKLEDLLKALLEKWVKDFSKTVPIIWNKFTLYG